MKNCMTKVFDMIRFPPAGGPNCPTEIEIEIGE